MMELTQIFQSSNSANDSIKSDSHRSERTGDSFEKVMEETSSRSQDQGDDNRIEDVEREENDHPRDASDETSQHAESGPGDDEQVVGETEVPLDHVKEEETSFTEIVSSTKAPNQADDSVPHGQSENTLLADTDSLDEQTVEADLPSGEGEVETVVGQSDISTPAGLATPPDGSSTPSVQAELDPETDASVVTQSGPSSAPTISVSSEVEAAGQPNSPVPSPQYASAKAVPQENQTGVSPVAAKPTEGAAVSQPPIVAGLGQTAQQAAASEALIEDGVSVSLEAQRQIARQIVLGDGRAAVPTASSQAQATLTNAGGEATIAATPPPSMAATTTSFVAPQVNAQAWRSTAQVTSTSSASLNATDGDSTTLLNAERGLHVRSDLGLSVDAKNGERSGSQSQYFGRPGEAIALPQMIAEASVRSGAVSFRTETPRLIGAQLADAAVSTGKRNVDVVLNPAELGRVSMKLTTTETGVTVVIQAERPETEDLMRRHIHELAKEFKEMGFTDIGFEFSGDGDSSQFGEGEGASGPALNGEGDAVANDDPVDILSNLNVTADGLDMRI